MRSIASIPRAAATVLAVVHLLPPVAGCGKLPGAAAPPPAAVEVATVV